MTSFDKRINFKHNNPIPRDRDIEQKEARQYVGVPTTTINEWRKKQKQAPVDGGDIILIPSGYVPLHMLEETINSTNNSPKNDPSHPSATDPNRHDGDTPHVNPDGTDNRDENPTDGRSIDTNDNLFKFVEIEKDLRSVWNTFVYESLLKCDKDEVKEKTSLIFSTLIEKTIVDVLFFYFGAKTIAFEKGDWVVPISNKFANEYCSIFLKNNKTKGIEWKDLIEEQFYSNSNLAKILNSLLRTTINYAKYLVMIEKGIKYNWVVNSNECGHKGRLKEDQFGFGVGSTKMAFPNQNTNTPNFSCDCTIEPKKEK